MAASIGGGLASELIETLSKRLGWSFNDARLLAQALTHRSVSDENNERLEFLGDGILNFVVAAELYHRRPDLQEGDLSRLRAALVNKSALAGIARSIELGDYVELGGGELKSGGHRRDSILADTLEAVLGAVYLDGGFDACQDMIQRLYAQHFADLPKMKAKKDPKTRLQEYLQSRQLPLPEYQVDDITGRAHEQVFTVSCRVETITLVGAGSAGSRRAGEQAAAADLLFKLGIDDPATESDK